MNYNKENSSLKMPDKCPLVSSFHRQGEYEFEKESVNRPLFYTIGSLHETISILSELRSTELLSTKLITISLCKDSKDI